MDLEVVWPVDIDEILVSKSDADNGSRTSRSDRKMISGIEAQSAALRAGTEFWSNAYEWARAEGRVAMIDGSVVPAATAGTFDASYELIVERTDK